MRTLFETSWVRDAWSPNLGQTGGTGNVFGDIATAASAAARGYFDVQKAEEEAKATQAQAAASQAQAQAAAAAAASAPKKILGMSPTTAVIVGVAGVAAIIGAVLLSNK